ncbi:MAG: GNAT family N-acetyltransferase [Bacteroidota bacterium]
MEVEIRKVDLASILPLRMLYLHELHAQSRYHACHDRGWADEYGMYVREQLVGYGSVKGLQELTDRDTIFEFYLLPPYRTVSKKVFQQLIDTSQATHAEAQTNDGLTARMLYAFGKPVDIQVALFQDKHTTSIEKQGVHFRKRTPADEVLENKEELVGAYVLEKAGAIIGEGGFLLHYNAPYADVFMEVAEAHRNQGYGRYLIQEIKKACYLSGRVPAARCNLSNLASRKALEAAGFEVAAYMLSTKLKKR